MIPSFGEYTISFRRRVKTLFNSGWAKKELHPNSKSSKIREYDSPIFFPHNLKENVEAFEFETSNNFGLLYISRSWVPIEIDSISFLGFFHKFTKIV